MIREPCRTNQYIFENNTSTVTGAGLESESPFNIHMLAHSKTRIIP